MPPQSPYGFPLLLTCSNLIEEYNFIISLSVKWLKESFSKYLKIIKDKAIKMVITIVVIMIMTAFSNLQVCIDNNKNLVSIQFLLPR